MTVRGTTVVQVSGLISRLGHCGRWGALCNYLRSIIVDPASSAPGRRNKATSETTSNGVLVNTLKGSMLAATPTNAARTYWFTSKVLMVAAAVAVQIFSISMSTWPKMVLNRPIVYEQTLAGLFIHYTTPKSTLAGNLSVIKYELLE